MRALAGRVPRAFASHKTPEGAAYGRYARAKVKRLGSLPDDARPWLKEAGRLTVALDRLHAEEEAVCATLANGAGRRQREKLLAQLARFDRRAGRLRSALEAAERRLEELASSSNDRARAGAGLPPEYIERVEGRDGE